MTVFCWVILCAYKTYFRLYSCVFLPPKKLLGVQFTLDLYKNCKLNWDGNDLCCSISYWGWQKCCEAHPSGENPENQLGLWGQRAMIISASCISLWATSDSGWKTRCQWATAIHQLPLLMMQPPHSRRNQSLSPSLRSCMDWSGSWWTWSFMSVFRS